MKRSVTLFLGAVLLAITASPWSTGADLYVLTNDTSGLTGETTTLGQINTTTGAFSTMLSDVGNGAGNLARFGNYLYFTTGIGISAKLKRFDLDTHTLDASFGPSIIGSDEPFMGMTYGGGALANKFYAWKQNPERNELGTIDPLIGTWTSTNNDVGPDVTNPPTGGRLANHGGTIYAAIYNTTILSEGQFGTVSSGSGFTQFSGPGIDDRYKYMNLASYTSSLYGLYGDGTIANHKLFTINTTDNPGALTQLNVTISGTGLGKYFHGAVFVPVPEPSTYALGMIAAGTAGWAMRRKKKRS